VVLRLPEEHADLVEAFSDWISAEVLATSIVVVGGLETPELERDPDHG
jgi:hypothetical protein